MRRSTKILLLFLIVPWVSPAEELFRDLALTHGFNLSAVTSRSKPLILGPVLQVDDGAPPAWRLAQWGTRFNLQGAPVVQRDGARLQENAGKRVVVHPGGLERCEASAENPQ